MAAAKYPLVIEQGATFSRAVQLSTGGPVASGGTPINLTGSVVRLHIRRNIRATTPLVSLTSISATADTTNIYISNAAAGQFVITITATDTTAIAWTAAVYDLEVQTSSGYVRRYLYGSVKVTKEVTR